MGFLKDMFSGLINIGIFVNSNNNEVKLCLNELKNIEDEISNRFRLLDFSII